MPSPMKPGHAAKGALRLLVLILMALSSLFLTSGDWDWTMGWLYLGMTFALVGFDKLRMMTTHPDLLAERMEALSHRDAPAADKALFLLTTGLLPLMILVLCGLDRRLGWSPPVPLPIQITALLTAAGGSLLEHAATMENPFYSAVLRLQTNRNHQVVATGPYSHVRHPGYAGAMIFANATSLALGSIPALLVSGLLTVLLLVRCLMEEAFLRERLPGYARYMERVPFRLVPRLW